MQVLGSIRNCHERGVPLLAFNSNGKILASIGLDGNSTLCLHEWLKGVEILRTPTNKGKVLALCFLANDAADADFSAMESVTPKLTASVDGGMRQAAKRDVVVTAGERHLHFWWTQGQNVQSQRALWGRHREAKKSTIMCVASANAEICITGSANGGLMIWEKFRVSCLSACVQLCTVPIAYVGSSRCNSVLLYLQHHELATDVFVGLSCC
jgi:hypothetical protein